MVQVESVSGGRATRASARYAARRDAILLAGAETLAQEGVSGFTLAAVAKRMGLHPVSLTYYFKRREELAGVCLVSAIDRLEAMLEAAEPEPTPQGRLAALVRGYLDAHRAAAMGEAPPLVPLHELRTFWRISTDDPVDQRYRAMRDRIGRLLEDPDLPPREPWRQRLAARLVLQQLASTEAWLGDYPLQTYPQVSARLADIMAFGVAAPDQRWPRDEVPVMVGAPCAQDPIRTRFLSEATDLINKQGWTGASIDRISARLKVTKGSFYHHHADKDELIDACVARSFGMMEAALAAAAEGETGWRRLFLFAAPLAVGQAHSGSGRMLRRHALRLAPEPVRARAMLRSRQLANALAGLISDGIADGSLRPVDANLAAQLVLAAINSAAMLDHVPDLTPQITLVGYLRPALRGLVVAR